MTVIPACEDRVGGGTSARGGSVRGPRTRPRPKTILIRQLKRLPIVVEAPYERPKTRGDCKDGVRPCPFVACRHHLYLEVEPNGHIKLNQPDVEPDQMQESCSLDVADRFEGEGAGLDEIGELLNITHERVRQLEVKALIRFRWRGRECA